MHCKGEPFQLGVTPCEERCLGGTRPYILIRHFCLSLAVFCIVFSCAFVCLRVLHADGSMVVHARARVECVMSVVLAGLLVFRNVCVCVCAHVYLVLRWNRGKALRLSIFSQMYIQHCRSSKRSWHHSLLHAHKKWISLHANNLTSIFSSLCGWHGRTLTLLNRTITAVFGTEDNAL